MTFGSAQVSRLKSPGMLCNWRLTNMHAGLMACAFSSLHVHTPPHQQLRLKNTSECIIDILPLACALNSMHTWHCSPCGGACEWQH